MTHESSRINFSLPARLIDPTPGDVSKPAVFGRPSFCARTARQIRTGRTNADGAGVGGERSTVRV